MQSKARNRPCRPSAPLYRTLWQPESPLTFEGKMGRQVLRSCRPEGSEIETSDCG
jgi:hypothetical protein